MPILPELNTRGAFRGADLFIKRRMPFVLSFDFLLLNGTVMGVIDRMEGDIGCS